MTCILWQFRTAQFTVTLRAEGEWDLDLSWDETGEVTAKLESGEYVAFCAHVSVTWRGYEVGTDYLGQCIYADPADFATDHRDRDPMNRNCSIMRAARGPVSICHYFPDMVRQAVAEARKTVMEMRTPYIRAA